MAGDNLNVWYDPDGDHLEIVFDQKAGYFEDTSLENVMRKRDAEGNLLAISIFNLSSFAGTRPSAESGHSLWAVFNLDVDDGETFDFDVALGYERFEDTDPESTSVLIAQADECAKCPVFFHADRSSPRHRMAIVERTLEIMHKPLSSPVVSIAENSLSPVSLTSLCRDQLALALRLFQPQSFFIFPRGWRDEGRRRAYVALQVHRAGAPTPYVLRGAAQVARFLEFAGRLREFHVDRNRYRFVRWDPLGSLVVTDLAEAEFLRRVARLMIATDLFEQANEGQARSGEMRLMWLVMAAEALFSDDDKSELSYRLAHRMAVLNGANADDRKRYWDLVRSMYDARNKLAHGAAYVRKPSGRLREVVGEAGFIEIPPDRLLAFNNLVRASILYFIALRDSPRDEVLDVLDRSLFDPSEVAGLRRRANQYWGFPGHEDEMLCSGRWVA